MDNVRVRPRAPETSARKDVVGEAPTIVPLAACAALVAIAAGEKRPPTAAGSEQVPVASTPPAVRATAGSEPLVVRVDSVRVSSEAASSARPEVAGRHGARQVEVVDLVP